jgi:hypothetical protein
MVLFSLIGNWVHIQLKTLREGCIKYGIIVRHEFSFLLTMQIDYDTGVMIIKWQSGWLLPKRRIL